MTQAGASDMSRTYHFPSHESVDTQQPSCSHAEAAKTPNVPHPVRRESDLPCLNLIGKQAVPSPQMPKGTRPNSPICCHASVHVGDEGGAWTCLEQLVGGSQ